MQLTQAEDYAVRALVYAALNPDARLEMMAESMAAPKSNLAKVIQSLARAGLVVTTRGRNGGVRLARPAEEIHLRQVVEAIQGPLRFFRCPRRGDDCPRDPTCAVYQFWFALEGGVAAELERVRIADLLHTCPVLNAEGG